MEEGEEIVVTAKRLRDEGGSSGGGGGGDWGWVSFYSTSGGFGADGFDFGGGGGAPSEQPPAEEPPPEEAPPEDEIVVTAPEPPTAEAFSDAIELTQRANEIPYIDFRVIMDGDTATIVIYDLLTGERSQFWTSPTGDFWTAEPFDLNGYETEPGFFRSVPSPSDFDWGLNIA